MSRLIVHDDDDDPLPFSVNVDLAMSFYLYSDSLGAAIQIAPPAGFSRLELRRL